MIMNERAQKILGELNADDISPIEGYDIERKVDQFGREYFSVSGGCFRIRENSDLSWDEWDGNEVYVSGDDLTLIYIKTIGIMKRWKAQLTEKFPEERFVIFASYDDGSEIVTECDERRSFTLRFWKIRENQGPDENSEYSQPVFKMIV